MNLIVLPLKKVCVNLGLSLTFACFPMFYMQTANIASYDFLAHAVDD